MDIKNARMSRENDCTRCSFHAKREAKSDVATLRSRRKQMVRHFDPRTGADRSVAHARVPFPVRQSGVTSPRPKTLRSARNIMQTWEPGAAELKCAKKVDVDAMMLALKSIMPETSFREAGVCKRRSFNFCADLRTAVLGFLDDKVPVSIMKQGPPMSTTNMVQTMRSRDEGEQGEDEEMKNEVTQDEIWSKYAGTVVKVITTAAQMVENGRIRKAARQAKMHSNAGPHAKTSRTAGEAVRAKAKTGTGNGKSQEGQGQNRQNDWSTPGWKGKSSTKNSKGSMEGVDEACDSGRSQTNTSAAHNQKQMSVSAC